jgi:mannosyltransferase
MNFVRSKRGEVLAIIVIVAVAVLLRFNRLTVWPLSLDESYSLFGAEAGFDFIWHILPTYETHPPFYTAMLRLWTLVAGTSVFGLRLSGILLSLLTLPIIYFAAGDMAVLARRSRNAVALPALALAACLPIIVDMSRFVRPYSAMIFVYALGTWTIVRLTLTQRESGNLKTGPWVIYLASLVLMIWLHNLGALYVLSLVAGLLIGIGPLVLARDHWRAFALGHGIAFLAALPALLILMDQAPTWTHSTWLAFDPKSLPVVVPVIFGMQGIFGILAATILVVAALMTRTRISVALLILALLPIILSAIISMTIAPVFLVRTLAACAGPMLLLMALGANASLLTRAALIISCLFGGLRTYQIQQLKPDQDWKGCALWLIARAGPKDMIYAYPNEGALPLRYALRDAGKALPIRDIPSGIPAHDPSGWYPTGSRGVQSLPPARLKEIAAAAVTKTTPTIWLLRYNTRFYDKGDSFLHIMERNRKVVGHFVYRDIDVVGLAQTPPTQ